MSEEVANFRRLNKNITKYLKIGGPIFLGVLTIVLLTIFLFVPLGKYNNAMDLIENKQYDEAKEILQDLDSFKDAQNQIELVNARECFDNLDYETGIEYVMNVDGQVEVNYDTDGGETLVTNEIIKKSKYINNDSNKTGYTFYGWSLKSYELDNKEYYAIINLKAEYNPISYSLTFNLDGGSFESDVLSTYTILDEVKIPNPSKEGYEFIGWTGLGLEEPTLDLVIPKGSMGNKEYTAHWESEGLLYELNEDGASYSVFLGDYDKEEVIIPSYHLGLPVTKIGDRAFSFYEKLTSVKIPNTIQTIGNYAFEYCSNLVNIQIPEGVTSVGMSSFGYCTNLINAELPSTLRSISLAMFSCCSNLMKVVIPEGIKVIEASAFSGCFKLTNIELPTTLKDIQISAFYSCESLTSIIIPEGVTNIGITAFAWCKELTSVKLPSTLQTIGDSAFISCTKLSSIVIPKGVTQMGTSVVAYCDNVIVFCEVNKRLSGWDVEWNYSNRPVYWAGEWEYVDGVPTPI